MKNTAEGRIINFSDRDRQYAIRIARSYTHSMEDAEDAVQNALLLAWRNRDSFRGESSFSTWFNTIVKNAALGMRRVNRYRDVPNRLSIDAIADIADAQPSNDVALYFRELLKTVSTFKSSSGGRGRKSTISILLKGDLSEEERAKIGGVPIGTMKSRVLRTRRMLADSPSVGPEPLHYRSVKTSRIIFNPREEY